jgi:ABC-type Na+ efflux pump permease subunit
MRRILLVARRDFIATVSTKGFIVGLLVLPALISLVAALAPRIPEMRRPVSGEVAIVDPTGRVSAHARAALAPDAIRARRLAEARRVTAPVAGAVGPVADQAIERAVGQAPSFTVVQDGPGDAIDDIRAWLLEAGSASPGPS